MKIIKHPEDASIRIEGQVDTTPTYAIENIARYISAASRRESYERHRPPPGPACCERAA